ncbi:B12-binding domain-containing protein [Maioricimonas sp. JC845]|uniref:B12-binding domain-containing protein n=1 Tax=Maioricimonas sp. JC845 TaxID=3232138 RepID=UPI003458F2BE
MKELVSPKQMARAIGASESSVKRWCDQGMINTVRTAGGHRRIPVNAVLSFAKSHGHKLVQPELLGLPPSTTGAGERSLERARKRLLAALVSGEDILSRQLVLDLFIAKHRVGRICDEVLAPVFHEIGDLWECGDVEVYQERRSCEICLRVLHELERLLPTLPPDGPVAVGGALDLDPYSLPTTMAELTMRQCGWKAVSLGSLLPAPTIAQAIADIGPRLVWISVSHIDDEDRVVDALNQVFEAARQHRAALAVGGAALTEEIRRRVRYSAFCDTMTHLETFADTLTAG